MKLSDARDVKLKYLKDFVEDWEAYWNENNDRYNATYYFVGVNTLGTSEAQTLEEMTRPAMQFNTLDSYGSKLLGEFADNEPGIEVSADDGVMATPQVGDVVECMEAHLRHDLEHSNNGNAGYKVMKDLLYGGFSCFEVHVDYVSNTSMDQEVPHRRVNPTYCGWDPLALESHKGDGQACYRKWYMSKEAISAKYGPKIANKIQYDSGDSALFTWAYKTSKQECAVIIEFYWKDERFGKLVKLPAEIVNLPEYKEFGFAKLMDRKKYEGLALKWIEEGIVYPLPQIVNERDTTFTDIYRFTFTSEDLIKTELTDYDCLPLVFVDGNSVEGQTKLGGVIRQTTKPIFYNAMDAQRFKDFAGQSFASELELTNLSQMMGPAEAFDEKTLYTWLDPQKPHLLTYKSMYKDNPEHRLDPPREIQRMPMSDAVAKAFFASDNLIESCMGFYDDRVSNDPSISGVAIREAKLQADAAASPYLDGYFEGLNRVAQIKLNLYPKYFKTPRSIPIVLRNGKKGFAVINSENIPVLPESEKDLQQTAPVYLDYDVNALLVKVKPGPSSALQKRQALDQINQMSATNPTLAQFWAGPGLEIYLSNVDMRQIDRAKALVAPWQQQQQQQAQEQKNMVMQIQNMQMQLQIQSEQLKAALTQAQVNKTNAETAIQEAKLLLENKKIDNQEAMDIAKMMLERQKAEEQFKIDVANVVIQQEKLGQEVLNSNKEFALKAAEQVVQSQKTEAENARTVVEGMVKVADHLHNREMDLRGREE